MFVIKSISDDDQTFGKFNGGVFVDNNRLNNTQYDAKKGSLRLTLKPEYLETLSVGEHTLRIEFTDGTVTHTFTVLPASAGSPGTGESGMTIALNCLLLIISAAGAAYAMLRKKKSVA